MFKVPFRKSTTIRTVEPALSGHFTSAEIASMARVGTLVHFRSGETLIAEGTDGNNAYFITSGSAAVSRGNESVAVLRSGDLVGERALVTGEPRNATVTALMPVTALQIDREQFAWLRLEWTKLKSLSLDLVEARL
jgi:CRP-like cAMP-binding protein